MFEGFHYAYHPIFTRLLELIGDGTIGELTHFQVAMEMPSPEPDDLRWSWPLAGGAFMDLGCYCVHAIRMLAAAQGGAPTLLHATADGTRRPDPDRRVGNCHLPAAERSTGHRAGQHERSLELLHHRHRHRRPDPPARFPPHQRRRPSDRHHRRRRSASSTSAPCPPTPTSSRPSPKRSAGPGLPRPPRPTASPPWSWSTTATAEPGCGPGKARGPGLRRRMQT